MLPPGCLARGRVPSSEASGEKHLLSSLPKGWGVTAEGRLVPQFPWVHVCRLLASQLQEEKQQHEEEVEGLHLNIYSLKQLSQQQAALIQDLQRDQGQEGLQHHVLRLKEENWVRGGAGGQDGAWGWLPPPCPVASCNSPLGSNMGDPAASPQLCSTRWVLVGVSS